MDNKGVDNMGKSVQDIHDIAYMNKYRHLNRYSNPVALVTLSITIISTIIMLIAFAAMPESPDRVYESPDGREITVSYDPHYIDINGNIFMEQDTESHSKLGVATAPVAIAIAGFTFLILYSVVWIPEKSSEAGSRAIKQLAEKSINKDTEDDSNEKDKKDG